MLSEGHFGGGVVSGADQISGSVAVTKDKQRKGGLCHVHVDGIELLDDSEFVCLVGCDKRTLGHVGLSYAARDGGKNIRVAQVNLGCFQGSLCDFEVGLGLEVLGPCVLVGLLAHCLAAQKGNAAVKAQLRCVEGGICAGDSCLCAFHFCVVGVRIDLVQGLARLHKGALREELFLQDAAHLGANLCLAEGRNAAGKLGCKGNVPGLDFEDGRVAHALFTCGLAVIACGQNTGKGEKKSQKDKRPMVRKDSCLHGD